MKDEDVERLLGELPPGEGSARLDREVERMIRLAEEARRPWRVPLWAAAAACVACAVLGFAARPILGSAAPVQTKAPVVFYEELRGPLPRALGGSSRPEKSGFFERQRSGVTAIYR